ncbi:MAG: hypothetical protein RX316_00005, partial [bacterium]|nr:hypothetical protein [bacterium]
MAKNREDRFWFKVRKQISSIDCPSTKEIDLGLSSNTYSWDIIDAQFIQPKQESMSIPNFPTSRITADISYISSSMELIKLLSTPQGET